MSVVERNILLWLGVPAILLVLAMAWSAFQSSTSSVENIGDVRRINASFQRFISANTSAVGERSSDPEVPITSYFIGQGTLAEQQAALTATVSQLANDHQLQVLSTNQSLPTDRPSAFVSVSLELIGTWPSLLGMIEGVANARPPLFLEALEIRGRPGALDDGQSDQPLSLAVRVSALARPQAGAPVISP